MNRLNEDDVVGLDDELRAIELELAQLRPRPIPSHLHQSLKRPVALRRLPSWLSVGSGVAAAAAMLLLVLNIGPQNNEPEPAPVSSSPPRVSVPRARPVSHVDSWERTWNEGPVLINNRVPAQRYLKQKMKTYQWIDEDRNVQIQIIIPEQRIEHKPLEVY